MKRLKLFNLVLGDMTLFEYEPKFIILATFSSDLHLLEAVKTTVFEDNLDPRYKGLMRVQQFGMLRDFVDVAMIVAKDKIEAEKSQEAKVQDKVDEKANSKKKPSQE